MMAVVTPKYRATGLQDRCWRMTALYSAGVTQRLVTRLASDAHDVIMQRSVPSAMLLADVAAFSRTGAFRYRIKSSSTRSDLQLRSCRHHVHNQQAFVVKVLLFVSMQVAAVSPEDSRDNSQLLQLPDTALSLVLQQLDPCSMACTAMTCSKLGHAAPAAISRLAVQFKTHKTAINLFHWLKQHSLKNLVECSISSFEVSLGYCSPPGYARQTILLAHLPCPHLRQLQLQRLCVQFEAAGGSPGLLHDCTALTGLDLMHCHVQDSVAARAAIAALPNLQRICWSSVTDIKGRECFADLQHPEALTHLSLNCSAWCEVDTSTEYSSSDDGLSSGDTADDTADDKSSADAGQPPFPALSTFVNLQHLDLTVIPWQPVGVPGGVPSQLAKLTALYLQYDRTDVCDVAEQLHHLSALTELKEFKLSGRQHSGDSTDAASQLASIGYLPQLTSLALDFERIDAQLQFSTSSTRNWACLTTLQSLSLCGAAVQPQALAALTQLQALTLDMLDTLEDVPYQQLFGAVSELTLLTQLDVDFSRAHGFQENPPPAASFTALTGSSNLCSLQVDCPVVRAHDYATNKAMFVALVQGCVLFEAGRVYPQLRHIDLQCEQWAGVPLSQQQLQLLCSCCPAIESLSLVLDPSASPEAFLPLLQLSALTHLELQQQLQCTSRDDGAAAPAVAAATAAVVGVAAQLTGLKQLTLWGLTALTDPVLWQLTALHTLEDLTLRAVDTTGTRCLQQGPAKRLVNKARCGTPPDVLHQLLAALQRGWHNAASSAVRAMRPRFA